MASFAVIHQQTGHLLIINGCWWMFHDFFDSGLSYKRFITPIVLGGGFRLRCFLKVIHDPGWDINKNTQRRRGGFSSLYSSGKIRNKQGNDECLVNDSSKWNQLERFWNCRYNST